MTNKPQRIQLSRKRGWRKPKNTVVVSRSTMWGNFAAKRKGLTGQAAVDEFRRWVAEEASWAWKGRAAIDLRGKDLACWCKLCPKHAALGGKPLGEPCPDCEPCHVDVLGMLPTAPQPSPQFIVSDGGPHEVANSTEQPEARVAPASGNLAGEAA